jgi:streptogramin lyase
VTTIAILVPDAQPDGITIGPDGDIWVALTGAGALAHIDPATVGGS